MSVLRPCSIVCMIYLFLCDIAVQSQSILIWDNHSCYNEVNCILDLGDSLWVGTDGGLACISKASLSVQYYNKQNSGLPDCKINAMIKEKDNIYLGTDCGLTLYEAGSWFTYTNQNSILPDNSVTALYYSDIASTIVAGFQDGNVLRIDSAGWNLCLGNTVQKPGSKITCTIIDTSGNIWAGSLDSSVYSYDGNDWYCYSPLATWFTGGTPKITVLFLDNSGTLYLGLENYIGFFRFSNNNYWSWTVNLFGYYTSPNKVTVDSSNTFWFSNGNHLGFRSWDGSVFDSMPGLNGHLTSRDLTCHVIDNQNSWIGSKQNGLDKVSGVSTLNIPLITDLPANTIADIDFDTCGTAWFALDSKDFACCHYDSLNFTAFSDQNTILNTNRLVCVSADSSSTIWFGHLGHGLYSVSSLGWLNYNTLNSNIMSDYITAVSTDYFNQILIGSVDGFVSLLANNTFSVITDYVATTGPANDKRILKIVPESEDFFWIASDSSGLIKCDYTSHVVVFDTSNSGIPSNHIEDIDFDIYHNVWVASSSGLAMFDNQNWIVFDTSNSLLPENHITEITFGKDSSLWIGTSRSGLVRYKNQLWKIFDKCNSPLISNEILSLKTAPDGRIFVGTIDGLSIIKEDMITTIPDYSDKGQVIVFPNPGGGIIQLEAYFKDEPEIQLMVYNSLDQDIFHEIKKTSGLNSVSFYWHTDQQIIKPGIYYYKVLGSKACFSGKVIVSK